MGFITVTQSVENLYGFLRRRLIHRNRLEAALQGCVFFNIFTVFVKCSGTDALQLSAGQGRLQDVGGINRTFRTACPDQGVQLIDKEYDVTSLTDFIHDLFEAVFKLTAVFGSGHH